MSETSTTDNNGETPEMTELCDICNLRPVFGVLDGNSYCSECSEPFECVETPDNSMSPPDNSMSVDYDESGKFTKGNKAGFASHPENINKAGGPKRPSLTRVLNEMLEKGIGDMTGEEVQMELLACAIQHAKEGNAAMLKELWARLDGKVADRIAGHDGGPIIDDETRERVKKLVEAADRCKDDKE